MTEEVSFEGRGQPMQLARRRLADAVETGEAGETDETGGYDGSNGRGQRTGRSVESIVDVIDGRKTHADVNVEDWLAALEAGSGDVVVYLALGGDLDWWLAYAPGFNPSCRLEGPSQIPDKRGRA